MTVLGAVVFGGLLGLAVLWLLLTAPDGDVDDAWDHSQPPERSNSASMAAGSVKSSPCAATHSSQK
ncbi:hypothetical protein JMUB5695_00347 [Mycobacterium heckeshornense]|uniref:Uncharacterized protein n=1 Tax=Mycobacterium heckeshornense TaxID=110505 RepID=A0A7R7YPU0_9MYCO|nr:hypothetical protein MHEC_03130 [Mycobacterium heckeshornense]BCQ06932.1 hypothetical protein JMUB5695_00347 [Mycobacterium heckeshornense]